MQEPTIIKFDELDWTRRPAFPGVEARIFTNEASFAPTDAMLARLEPGREIPWHVHETDTEVVYTLQGRSLLLCAEHEGAEEVIQYESLAGRATIIPPGLWHSVQNPFDETMIAFAIHTPA
jgi:oxalate decarboxylase/phosphoglucose isomerase-like protein (cupin superfamily)